MIFNSACPNMAKTIFRAGTKNEGEYGIIFWPKCIHTYLKKFNKSFWRIHSQPYCNTITQYQVTKEPVCNQL